MAGLLGLGGLGTTELLVLLLIVVVIFGARRLPEIGSGLGRAIKNFRSGLSSQDEVEESSRDEDVKEVTDGKSS